MIWRCKPLIGSRPRSVRAFPASYGAGGFTLIELLVVLSVAALMLALIVPRLTGAEARFGLRSASRELDAALRATRTLAMTSGHTSEVIIDVANSSFQQRASSAPVRLPRGIQVTLTTTTSDRLDSNRGRIRFFPEGTSTGGGVELSAGSDRATVLVDWLTGRVSIDEPSNANAR
jgi:general secretion pathway protein H